MNPVLPNADDPQGGTPMNTDDTAPAVIVTELDGTIKPPTDHADWLIIYQKYLVDYHDKLTYLIRKSSLHRAIDELNAAQDNFKQYHNGDISPYLHNRIAVLQAELQQAEKEQV